MLQLLKIEAHHIVQFFLTSSTFSLDQAYKKGIRSDVAALRYINENCLDP
jgi:hypothetical protein